MFEDAIRFLNKVCYITFVFMNKRLAVIDLGTNTFHLLIVDSNTATDFQIIHKEKVFAKLGAFGLLYFKPEIINRALKTLISYKNQVNQFKVDEVLIFGTAALRASSNTQVLIEKIKENCNWDVQVISGKKEATLIYYGVKQTLNFKEAAKTPQAPQTPYLIMDIGGGSVEFILANNNKVLWSESFDIGAALLRKQFHVNEPISKIEILKLNQYLEETLLPLQEAIKTFKTQTLIGASGSFDTVADLSLLENDSKVAIELPIHLFNQIYKDLLQKNLEERLDTPNLVSQRADMIVVSLILIQHVLNRFNIQYLYKSDYALKEGALWAYHHHPDLIL